MAPALRRQCQLEGCDYITVVGLATQDPVLKNLELHLRFHELTTEKTEPAVAVENMKLAETNGEGTIDFTSETNGGGTIGFTSGMEAFQMIKNLLAGEMQEKISEENTKTPKYERCGHYGSRHQGDDGQESREKSWKLSWAWKLSCNKCGIKGHIAKGCKSKNT